MPGIVIIWCLLNGSEMEYNDVFIFVPVTRPSRYKYFQRWQQLDLSDDVCRKIQEDSTNWTASERNNHYRMEVTTKKNYVGHSFLHFDTIMFARAILDDTCLKQKQVRGKGLWYSRRQ